jgi:hypothetical protein
MAEQVAANSMTYCTSWVIAMALIWCWKIALAGVLLDKKKPTYSTFPTWACLIGKCIVCVAGMQT